MYHSDFQRHFTEDSYYIRQSDGQRLLKDEAIPTLFAHKPPPTKQRKLNKQAAAETERTPKKADKITASTCNHDHTYNGNYIDHTTELVQENTVSTGKNSNFNPVSRLRYRAALSLYFILADEASNPKVTIQELKQNIQQVPM